MKGVKCEEAIGAPLCGTVASPELTNDTAEDCGGSYITPLSRDQPLPKGVPWFLIWGSYFAIMYGYLVITLETQRLRSEQREPAMIHPKTRAFEFTLHTPETRTMTVPSLSVAP